MSDSTCTTGRIEFRPPLAWHQYREAVGEFADDDRSRPGASMLMLVEDVSTVDTDEGELTRRVALGVTPRFDGVHGKTRHLEDELGRIAHVAWNAGAELDGRLYTESDSGGLGIERWSIVARPGVVGFPYRMEREIACLVWPDGSDSYVRHDDGYYVLGDGPDHFTPGSGSASN